MIEHTIRVYRRRWRWVTLECIECNAMLARGRSGDLRPEILWHYEREHKMHMTQKAPPEVHHPDRDH